jgi:hypothetical protein
MFKFNFTVWANFDAEIWAVRVLQFVSRYVGMLS